MMRFEQGIQRKSVTNGGKIRPNWQTHRGTPRPLFGGAGILGIVQRMIQSIWIGKDWGPGFCGNHGCGGPLSGCGSEDWIGVSFFGRTNPTRGVRIEGASSVFGCCQSFLDRR